MMPSKYAIAEYWGKQPYFEGHPFPDIGEPSCFACGYYQPGWDAPTSFEKRWELARLERAHIIARSSGGSDEASNLVLLCKSCHKDAPMVNEPRLLFLWMSKRGNWWLRWREKIKSEADHMGITKERIRRLGPVDHDLIRRIGRNLDVGDHWSDEDGARISDGSVLAVLGRYVDIKEGLAPEPPALEPEVIEDEEPLDVEAQPAPECDLLYSIPGHCEACNLGHARAIQRLIALADRLREETRKKSAT